MCQELGKEKNRYSHSFCDYRVLIAKNAISLKRWISLNNQVKGKKFANEMLSMKNV